MDPQTRLLISGSRKATPAMLTYARRTVALAKEKGWAIIVGDADGVDAAVIDACDDLGVPVEVHGAKGEMRRQSKTGTNIPHDVGYLARDEIMAGLCTACLAIWNGRSRGTHYTLIAASALGKQCWLIDFLKPEGQRTTTFNAVSAETGRPSGPPDTLNSGEGGPVDPDAN